MKIMMNPNVARVSQSYGVKLDKAQDVGKVKADLDKIEISDAAKDFQVGMSALRSVPDVREERVSQLRDLIQSGNYKVSGREVAEKMIEEIKASIL